MVQYKRRSIRFYYKATAWIEMNNPKVSIIVATYNQEATIGRALDSILAQNGDFDYEIIIGEDCSSDKTPDICREYALRYPDRIKLILNETNKGLIDNYFDCILAASGDYIADCAGDDYWIDPRKLDKQCRILDSDSSITLVHTGWNYNNVATGQITPATQNKSPYHKPIMEKGSLLLPVLSRKSAPIVHLCTAMYRRDALLKLYSEDEGMFRGEGFTCEDLQIITSLAAAGKIAYIPDITLNYTVGTPSISSDENFTKLFRFYFGTIKQTRYIQLKYQIPDADLKDYYRTAIAYIIACAFNAGDWDRCLTGAALAKEYGIKLPVKSRLLIRISTITHLREIALKIKTALRR